MTPEWSLNLFHFQSGIGISELEIPNKLTTVVFFTRDSCTSRYCWARISYGDSVCPSVRLSRPGTDSSPDERLRVFTYDSLESLVSYEIIWRRWVRRFPSNEGIKEEYPLRNRIGSSSVRTVADRHRLAAYHNKHCWRAFQWYQHRWPWTTLNPQNRGF